LKGVVGGASNQSQQRLGFHALRVCERYRARMWRDQALCNTTRKWVDSVPVRPQSPVNHATSYSLVMEMRPMCSSFATGCCGGEGLQCNLLAWRASVPGTHSAGVVPDSCRRAGFVSSVALFIAVIGRGGHGYTPQQGRHVTCTQVMRRHCLQICGASHPPNRLVCFVMYSAALRQHFHWH
jgi:hypothetical protein